MFAILKLVPDLMFDNKTTQFQHTNEKHSVKILTSEIVAKITDIKCISIFYIHEDFILYQEDLTLSRSSYSETFWIRGSFPSSYSKSLLTYAMTTMLTTVIDLLNNSHVIQKDQDDHKR